MGECQMAGCGLDGDVEVHRTRPCGHTETPTIRVCADGHGTVAANVSTCTTCGERNRLHLVPAA